MVPAEVTLAVVEEELGSADAWARRHGWEITFDHQELLLLATSYHPADQRELLLEGRVDGYRALPPAWRFIDPETKEPMARSTPRGDSVNGRSSVLHGVGVICAHFSR